jgi:hypothetical protein
MLISLTKEKIRSLLEDAFQKGWEGFLDCKYEYVENIVEELEKNFSSTNSMTSYSDLGVTFSSNTTNTNSGYYYYCTPGIDNGGHSQEIEIL